MKKEKIARKLLRTGKIADGIDKLNESAHEFRQSEDYEKAIELLEEGSKLALDHRKYFEGSLCERSLSEIHAELGNREQCFRHIVAFRKLSKDCQSRSQEQLSYHVEAWCLQQLFLKDTTGTLDIERAIQLTKKSRELVESYKGHFKDGDPGGPPHIRKAQLFTLEAQLYSQLENNDKALQLLEKTASLLKPNDKSARFEMLRTKCSIAPVEKRVDIAELMDDDAPEEKKAQTLCELSHQYLLASRLEKSYKALANARILHEKQLSPCELEDATKRLSIIYRLVQYSRILRNPKREPKLSMCQLHEIIGDLYDKYFQTLMAKEKKEYKRFIRENILKNYEKMLENKRNDEDALRAYEATALVYGDLDDFVKSKMYFEKRLDLLKKTRASTEKVLDTRVSIFNCLCKLDHSNLEERFDELNNEVVSQNIKKELFEIWENYWISKRNDENAQKWRKAADSIPDVNIKNEDDETDVLFWRLSEKDILEKCKEDNEMLKLESMSEHRKNKTNDKGETMLHIAAMKSDNEIVVEKMCRLGCKVDARDNGGWTPLSEAVTHNQFGNAQVLIRYGADVNVKSIQSYISEDSQSSSDDQNHYGLTPLMDACANGFIEIADLLINNHARVDIRDSGKWTAYQHLMRYIDSQDEVSDKMTKFAEYLKNLTAISTSVADIPPSSIRTLRTTAMEDDSQPDEVDELILDAAASRKRKILSNSEIMGTTSKRRQHSEDYTRHSPSPSSSSRPMKKRSIQSSISPHCQQPQRIIRPTSKSPVIPSLRNSLSPRRSISPTTTVRSAPSVFGADDDLQVLNGRGSYGKPGTSSSTKIVPPFIAQRPIPSSKIPVNQGSTDIVVKCCFEYSSGIVSDEIRPVKLPMKRSLSIAEVKNNVVSNNSSISKLIIKDVWSKNDEEKAELGDKMLLSHLSDPNQREIALVFQLSAPPAHVVYQESIKDPIAEVTNQLKLLSTDKTLDLSSLFLDSTEISEVFRVFKKSDRPRDCSINLGFCELSVECESNLQYLLDECSNLILSNTLSKTGFSVMFEKSYNRLEKLEITEFDFRDESQLNKILKSSSNLKSLKIAGVHFNAETTISGQFPEAISSLKFLTSLDLSYNDWLTEEILFFLLKSLKNLEVLVINETKNEVSFQCDWLPKLSSFSARGSNLDWCSLFEFLSISERMSFVDIQNSNVEKSLPQELKNTKPTIEILF